MAQLIPNVKVCEIIVCESFLFPFGHVFCGFLDYPKPGLTRRLYRTLAPEIERIRAQFHLPALAVAVIGPPGFLREQTGVARARVELLVRPRDPDRGNVEQFIGVAQVPIGLAGPLLVNGEHAQGEFYVPLATAEGTLVASYNRGMRLLYEAGGVTTTILDDRMQRAPAFLFASAREARAFGEWLTSTSTRSRRPPRPPRSRGQPAGHRAVLGQPHPLHALQLHDRRRRRPEPHRARPPRRPAPGSSRTTRASSTSSSSRTSRPTRRARR